jgi:hypothetical protein
VKAWTLDYYDDDSASGRVRVWLSTEAEALTLARQLDDDPPGGYFRNDPALVEIPTRKVDLIAWLNSNASMR